MHARDYRSRVRAEVVRTHIGPGTLEEAVQEYINRNAGLHDLSLLVEVRIYTSTRNFNSDALVYSTLVSLSCDLRACRVQEVLRALRRNPRLSLEVDYEVVALFVRETVRLAWDCANLAHPLDVALAFDGELFDDLKCVVRAVL